MAKMVEGSAAEEKTETPAFEKKEDKGTGKFSKLAGAMKSKSKSKVSAKQAALVAKALKNKTVTPPAEVESPTEEVGEDEKE